MPPIALNWLIYDSVKVDSNWPLTTDAAATATKTIINHSCHFLIIYWVLKKYEALYDISACRASHIVEDISLNLQACTDCDNVSY